MEYSVSVIIPMYNREHIVGRALESVFRQTLKNIEIIVIDDGSADNSVAVVRNYQKNHPNLRLFEVKHNGPGLARNVGIKNAKGKYIVFLDSDDFVPERAYELLYQAAEDGDCDFVVGQIARKIDSVGRGKWHVPEKISHVIRGYEGRNCAQGYDIAIVNPSMCNRMMRRDFVRENDLLYDGELFGEDMVYNLKLFRLAGKATAIDEIVYCYETNYTSGNSTISTVSLEPVLSGVRSADSYALFFDSIGRIDWEIDSLLGPFEFVLQRFNLLSKEDKTIAFETIKNYLRRYQGRKEYEIAIEHLMGMALDTLLLLPYPAYETYKKLTAPPVASVPGKTVYVPSGDPKATVLTMYQNGQLGLRFIVKYFIAWLKYKLKRK